MKGAIMKQDPLSNSTHDPMMPAGEHSLRVNGLSKNFRLGTGVGAKQLHALEDVSFTIQQGEILALVGESGSGKSTAARLIARLMSPTSGSIHLGDRDVLSIRNKRLARAYRKNVQMIFQDPFSSFNPVHRIEHHLARPIRIHEIAKSKGETQEHIYELLSTVGLNPPREIARKYPYELSGGQRQRVAIARALAVDPQIVLADEPVSMLDVSIRIGVLNLMLRLKEERNLSYLYITHDLASARYIAERTIVLYGGFVMEEAPSDELMLRPHHPYTKLLLSAVPDVNRGFERTSRHTDGEVLSRIDPLPGCPFAARCPNRMTVCTEVTPSITQIEPKRFVRCHLFGEQVSSQ